MGASVVRFVGAIVLGCAIGCSGTATPVETGPAAIVTVSPSNAVVLPSASADFAATITTDSIGISDSVHWRVTGSGCSGDACGTITSRDSLSGRFVAPAEAPIPATVAIVAVADSDPESIGVSYVTIGTTPISVTIDPVSTSVANCGRVDLTATVSSDTAGAGVTWSLEGSLCDAGSCGAVFPETTASGATATFAGPCSSSLPLMATVRVRATSISDPSRSGTAAVSVMR